VQGATVMVQSAISCFVVAVIDVRSLFSSFAMPCFLIVRKLCVSPSVPHLGVDIYTLFHDANVLL
jgi:hypothetical protein